MSRVFAHTVAAFLVCMLLTSTSYSTGAAAQEAKELTDDEFYALRHDKDKCLLVLAHAPWSYQSKHAKVVVNKLAAYMPTSNYSEVEVAMIDVHKYRKLGRVEGVARPPMFVFYTFGGAHTHYAFHDDPNLVSDMMNHVAERLDNDKHHRMLEQEKAVESAKWNIPHPNPGTVVDFETENSFYELTHDITRTVMVLFYANWCTACKEYLPEYVKLAAAFENDPKIVIGKLNAEKFPQLADKYKVEGYPTLVVFYKNREGKIGTIYQGDRELEHLQGYLTQHHTMMVDFTGGHSKMMTEIQELVRQAQSAGQGEDEATGDPNDNFATFPEDGRVQ